MIRFMLAAAAVVFAASGAFAAETCTKIKGGGIGATEDIARFMSAKALKDLQDKYGEKGVGKVTTVCSNQTVYIDCTSEQKSCKGK